MLLRMGPLSFILYLIFELVSAILIWGWVQDQEDWGAGFKGSITAYLSTCMDGRAMEREDYVGDFPPTLGWKRAGHWRVGGHGYNIKEGWDGGFTWSLPVGGKDTLRTRKSFWGTAG